jgi:CRISPR/Cas system-associated protein Cas10 (large subunit of type III CRISPR-Cas system)
MSSILYLIGLIIGATVFIYLYSSYQSGKEKFKEMRGQKNPPAPTVNPERVDYFSISRVPGTRLCPLCGKELSKYEALYASEVEEEGKKKILIHGCKYCYKDKEDKGSSNKQNQSRSGDGNSA